MFFVYNINIYLRNIDLKLATDWIEVLQSENHIKYNCEAEDRLLYKNGEKVDK